MYRRLLFIILLAFYFCGLAKSQEEKTRRDSLNIKRDSLNIEMDSLNTVRDSTNYKALEEYSQKSKITRFIHKLIFKPAANR